MVHTGPHHISVPNEGSDTEIDGIGNGVRIINLKMAEDGNGLIARLYSLNRQESLGLLWPGQTVERNTVDEQPLQEGAWQGFETLRIGADRIRLNVREIRESPQTGAARHVIGIEVVPDAIRDAVEGVTRAFMNDGVFYEYYDGYGRVASPRLLRKGTPVIPYIGSKRITQTIRDYGWTATLYAAMVHEHAGLFSPDAE